MASLTDRSALSLQVSLPGLAPYVVGLNRYRAAIADWVPFWRDRFAPAFYQQTLENFVSEGGASGARWAPLSRAYAAWKAQRFPGNGILVRSGALKASLLGPGAPYSVFRPTSTSLDIGSSVPWGMFHQLGTRAMPQRPPLRLTPAFMSVMGKAMQRHVQAAWADARRGFVSVVANAPIEAPGGGGGLL